MVSDYAQRKADLKVLSQAIKEENERRSKIEALFGKVVSLDLSSATLQKNNTLQTAINQVIQELALISKLGDPIVPLTIMEAHRRDEFVLTKVTGNARVDYGRHMRAAGDFLSMAAQTHPSEAKVNIRMAREHLSKLLRADTAFIKAEAEYAQGQAKIIQAQTYNLEAQRRVA